MTEQGKMLLFCARSAEFQKLFAEDKELDRLEALKHRPNEEFSELCSVIGWGWTVTAQSTSSPPIDVTPVTPALWALLWTLGCRYVNDRENVTDWDSDLMLYLLVRGVKSFSGVDAVIRDAAGFIPAHGLDYTHVRSELFRLIRIAERPLEMLPASASRSGEKPRFDADWLTRIASVASRYAGVSSEHAMLNMSLTEAYLYCIQYLRSECGVYAERIPDGDLAKAIHDRAMTMAREFYDAHKPQEE